MSNTRLAAFQWLAGSFAGTLGALMLVSPHQFASPVYAPFQAYLPLVGTGLLVSGLGLPATLVFAGHRRWLGLLVHIVLAAAFAALGLLIIAGGGLEWRSFKHFHGCGPAVRGRHVAEALV